MGQIIVRQLDDAKLARLKERAKRQRTSAEALAREAIHRAADTLSAEEKLALAQRLRAETAELISSNVAQTPGWQLIREGRDER